MRGNGFNEEVINNERSNIIRFMYQLFSVFTDSNHSHFEKKFENFQLVYTKETGLSVNGSIDRISVDRKGTVTIGDTIQHRNQIPYQWLTKLLTELKNN